MESWLLVLTLLLASVQNVFCLPTGAPTQACSNLMPNHGGNAATDPNTSPPSYYIVSRQLPFVDGNYMYTAGESYDIQLMAVGTTFRGFLIQSQATDGSLIGTFDVSPDSANVQLRTCSSDPDSTITHTSRSDKTSVSFRWTAPSGSDGTVVFRYSVVMVFATFYVNLNAADYRLNCTFDPTPVGNHSLIFRSPDGCMRDECEYYAGLSPNEVDPTYLDVYLEGNAAGWLAIGFSLNRYMDNDDVLGCRVVSGSVTAVDTWNPSPRFTANVLDNTQNGLCIHSTSFTNGRIYCSFSRTIAVTDVGQDYNLNSSYWLLFGRRIGDQGTLSSLGFHGRGVMAPRISNQQYNPVSDNGTQETFCPLQATTSITQFPLVFRWPDGCLLDSCNYLVGLGPNPSDPTYLDVYLEGVAASWLAIGFSNDTFMGNDDVFGCYVNNSAVTVVDSWNPFSPRPPYNPNMFDDTQRDLCVYSTSFTNGRISCRFSRTVNGTDMNQDYDLDDMFYLLFARRTVENAITPVPGLSMHSMTPRVSMDQYNPLQDNNTDGRCPLQTTSIGSHRLIFGFPSGCERASCDYYVGLSPNPVDSAYLDVYLEGNATGWIAIGFSTNMLMENDDVLGCRYSSSSSSVIVADTWNPSTRHQANMIDNTQDGLCSLSTSFTNGRISCMFSRTIAVTDVGQDYNLNSSYWLFFGRRIGEQNPTLPSFGNHNVPSRFVPMISNETYNPVIDTNQDGCPPAPTSDNDFTFRRGSSGDPYYFAARVNPNNQNYVDIRLEATATGWVGIGFSTDRQMGQDDVLACQRNPSSDMVAVVDTWNPGPRYQANQLDPNQNGVCTHSTEFSNGRINCTFSRLIIGMAMDHNLNDSLFQLYATSSTRGTGALAQHDRAPDISTDAIVVTEDTGVAVFPREQLTKVHGILMIIAWPLLAVSAIFFAAWMKPALPNGEWFQVHRAFMIVSLVTTLIGFIFIFVANARQPTPGLISFACGENTTHFVIGIIVVILQIVNPIIAIFRCKPDSSSRWIFNLTHGSLIGFAAELLALVNVGLGIALLEAGGCPREGFGASQYTILWVYIAFVVFLLILQISLFLVFTLVALNADPEKRRGLAPSLLKCLFESEDTGKEEIEMTTKGSKSASDDPPERKPASSDSPIRWGGFAIFIIGTFGLMLALIIMIAIN